MFLQKLLNIDFDIEVTMKNKNEAFVSLIGALIVGGLILTTSFWLLTRQQSEPLVGNPGPGPVASPTRPSPDPEPSQPGTESGPIETYRREGTYGLEVKYSSDIWDLNKGDDYDPSELTGTRDLIQLVAQDQENSNYKTNIMFKIEQVEEANQSLSEYADTQVFRIQDLETFEIESKNRIDLNGESAYELIYSGDDGEHNLKRKRIIITPQRGSTLPYFHLITYTSAVENYEQHLKAFNEIVQSTIVQ